MGLEPTNLRIKSPMHYQFCYNLKSESRAEPLHHIPLIYDFLIYTMKEKDCFDGYDFFISEEWHTFVSNLFNININKYIAYSLHYHKAPSKNGFAHLDLNLCTAKKDPLKKIKIINDCDYANDTAHNEKDLTKIVRSVSAIYYLNNNGK